VARYWCPFERRGNTNPRFDNVNSLFGHMKVAYLFAGPILRLTGMRPILLYFIQRMITPEIRILRTGYRKEKVLENR
jgi:hypothetical protein